MLLNWQLSHYDSLSVCNCSPIEEDRCGSKGEEPNSPFSISYYLVLRQLALGSSNESKKLSVGRGVQNRL